MTSDERGGGTVLTAGVAAVLMTVATAVALCIAWFSVIRHAEQAAELSAVAAASAAASGTDPCDAAAQTALRNRGRLSGCAVRGTAPDVVVEVGVVVRLEPHIGLVPETIERRAAAGVV